MAQRLRHNEDKMSDLRQLARAGWPQRRIAAVLGVGQTTVSNALIGLRIPHIRIRGEKKAQTKKEA